MFLTKDRGITEKGVRALFVANYLTRRRGLIYPKIVQTIDSYVEKDFARAIGTVPQLEQVMEDVESTPVTGFRDYSWDWTNRLFRATASLSRSLVDFDQTGQSRKLLAGLAARLANLPDAILMSRLVAGSLYSGEKTAAGAQIALYATDHLAPMHGGDAQSNLLTGSTSVAFVKGNSLATVALQIQQDFRDTIATMRGYVDDHGQPWHSDVIEPGSLKILCSPLMEQPMKMAFQADMIGHTNNTMKGAVGEVITSNYLSSATSYGADWWLFNTNEMARPIILSQFRHIRDDEILDNPGIPSGAEGPSMEELRSLSSVQLETNMTKQGMNAEADVILNNRFLFAARWRGEIFGGEWRNTVAVNNG